MSEELTKARDLVLKYGGHNPLLIPYGSRVYGTHKEDSDFDYIAIVADNGDIVTGTEYAHDNINIHVYKEQNFKDQLRDHKIHALEAYYLQCVAYGHKLDLVKLRHELSEKASNSFVKAKKKIDKEKDFYVGWKSLFHSLRILTFGTRIALENRIDYSEANHYWFEIRDAQQYNWAYFKEKYQPVYNSLATEFRKLAPKE